MKLDRYLPYLVVLGIFVSLLLLYTAYDKAAKSLVADKLVKVLAFQDPSASFKEINKVFALEAFGLISIVFLLGPLSKLKPDLFAKFLYLRKPLGLIGFGMAAVHGVYSLLAFYNLDLNQMILQNSKVWGLVSAFIALTIFFLMGITSGEETARRMGYRNWKMLQTCGYAGLLFALLHFFIFESKPDIGLDVRPYGLLFFYLGLGALLLRLAIIFIKTPERKSYEEHVGKPKAKAKLV